MFDPTIHAHSIARHFYPADFVEDNLLLNPIHRQTVIEKAVELGCSGFGSLSLRVNKFRGKNVYQLTDMSERLVVRHITRNIRRLTGVKQDDREFIIKCIRGFLEEGTKYRVYKFDVKSFYESVSSDEIVSSLENDDGFSGQSAAALRSLFIELKKAGVSGLPRGFGLSATLAEYLLRPFDSRVSEIGGVWFYARFVDDIFIITSGNEDKSAFIEEVTKALPHGLSFNEKSGALEFEGFRKGAANAVQMFDFLGYRFSVHRPHQRKGDNKIARTVTLDIAPSKVRRIKSRVALSLRKFSADGNYVDLLSRIRLLTSNFNFVDRRTSVRRVAGIYFNYPLIDFDHSSALNELDAFLRNALMSAHPRNRLFPALSGAQRLALVKLTFRAGFRNKRFFAFGPVRLAQLTACWSHA